MANKNMRTCICCGREYKYCFTCAEDKKKPMWYRIYDSENCKEIFKVCSDYPNDISLEDAKAKLSELDLSNKDTFVKNVANAIDKIMGVKPIAKEAVTEIIIENKIDDTKEISVSIENKKNEKPYNTKGFNKKSNG